MCWSQEVSLTTFAIGTLINVLVAYAIPNPTIIALVFLWEIVLLVQLYEALTWNDLSQGRDTLGPTNVLMAAILLQPIVLGFVLLGISDVQKEVKYFTAFLLVLYTAWCVYNLSTRKINRIRQGCNLEYYWWDDFWLGAVPYLIALFAIGILLVRPWDLTIFITVFLALTLLLSFLFYKNSVGSIWCWMGAFGMAIIALYWLIREKYMNES